MLRNIRLSAAMILVFKSPLESWLYQASFVETTDSGKKLKTYNLDISRL